MQQDAITHDLQLKPHAPRLDEGRADYRNDYRLHSRLHTQPGQQQGTHTTRASNTHTKSKQHTHEEQGTSVAEPFAAAHLKDH